MLFVISTPLFSAEMVKVADIDFSKIDVSSEAMSSTNFVTQNNGSIGIYWTIDFADILSKYINIKDFIGLILIKDADGKVSSHSLSDFDSGINVIAPQLIISRSNYNLGDTLVVVDAGENKIVDFAKDLQNHQKNMIRKRIKLQLEKIHKDDRSIFGDKSLIFPTDKCSKRWIKNIKNISIYSIKTGE